MLQDTYKTPQDVLRHLQDAPRRALDTSKSRFWWILEQVDTKITSSNDIMLKQPESKIYIFFQ